MACGLLRKEKGGCRAPGGSAASADQDVLQSLASVNLSVLVTLQEVKSEKTRSRKVLPRKRQERASAEKKWSH